MVTVIVAAVGNELQMELHVVFPVLQCRKLICPIPAAFLHGELLQFRNIFRGKRRRINPAATGFNQNPEIHDIADLLLIDPDVYKRQDPDLRLPDPAYQRKKR